MNVIYALISGYESLIDDCVEESLKLFCKEHQFYIGQFMICVQVNYSGKIYF